MKFHVITILNHHIHFLKFLLTVLLGLSIQHHCFGQQDQPAGIYVLRKSDGRIVAFVPTVLYERPFLSRVKIRYRSGGEIKALAGHVRRVSRDSIAFRNATICIRDITSITFSRKTTTIAVIQIVPGIYLLWRAFLRGISPAPMNYLGVAFFAAPGLALLANGVRMLITKRRFDLYESDHALCPY